MNYGSSSLSKKSLPYLIPVREKGHHKAVPLISLSVIADAE